MSRPRAGSTAVLVPGPFGTLRLFQRRGPGRLQPTYIIHGPLELRSCLSQLPWPRTAILCDARYRDLVANTILDLAELFVVPAHWLRDLDPWDLSERANRAAALVAAHRQRPIQHILGGAQLDLLIPF